MLHFACVSTTTVRLDDDDDAILEALAPEYGGRSSVIRHALRELAGQRRRHEALGRFLADWDDEAGPVDEDEIAAAAERYGL